MSCWGPSITRRAISVGVIVAGLVALAPVAGVRADSAYLYGIHWWGWTPGQAVDANPATMLDCPTHGGWDLETVLTHSASWWGPSHFVGLYQTLHSWNVTIITRIDFDWGQTVPAPSNAAYANWPSSCVSAVNTLRNYCHIWVIGNEPNILDEGTGWPDRQVTPTGYATIYRNVRNAIHASASASPLGEHIVCVAPPSPGGVIGGVRWMDGNQWLGQVLDNIPDEEVDGIAIHSYGGTLADFHSTYVSQLNLIDSKGLQSRPVYITEWNKVADESSMAQFVRDSYADLNNWNQVAGHHNIRCLCWFIYDADQQAGGAWNKYSIEHWRSDGNPLGDPGDIYTAFSETVDLRYAAGVTGVRGVTADFSAAPTSGRIPLAVQFTDQSTGTVTSWTWDFGDEGTSHSPSPSHTYEDPGLYTVSLTVSGPYGQDTLVRTDYINVKGIPGDFDEDRDVDLDDFGSFQTCLDAPGFEQTDPECAGAKLDADNDVDAADLVLFLRCISGKDVEANPSCAD